MPGWKAFGIRCRCGRGLLWLVLVCAHLINLDVIAVTAGCEHEQQCCDGEPNDF